MNKQLITPADECGNCEYKCREDGDIVFGTITYCDYQGTCDYKINTGKTARKVIHICNNIVKE